MNTESVTFQYNLRLNDTDESGLYSVMAVHDRIQVLQDQNLQLLEAFRQQTTRALRAEERFDRLRNSTVVVFAVGIGLGLGYCLSKGLLTWMLVQ